MTSDLYRDEAEAVRTGLEQGALASTLANQLHQRGLGAIQIMLVFRQATGASIPDLKAFGQWWGLEGVTDVAAFDSWAAQVFRGVIR